MQHTYVLREGMGHGSLIFPCQRRPKISAYLVRVSFVGQSHWGRWRRCNIPMICVKAWVIDFPLPEKAEKVPPIRWEFRLFCSLIGDADGDATYLWSVWRHGSLIFPCQRRPKKFRLSGESFVCWSVSFARPGCWRRCNIPMICVKAWVIDFPLPQKAEKVPPIRWEFRLFCSLIGDADGDATYLWSVWRHGSLIFPCQRRSNCRIATSKGIETETKKIKNYRMIEQGRHMPS